MGFFDSVRDTSGAVFSMDQLKGGDAFCLCSTPRKVSSSYAGFHQTSWSYVSNLARDRHTLISQKHQSGGSNCSDRLRPAPHLRQRNATVSQQEGHSRPQDEQSRTRLPRDQGSRLRTRKLRTTPATCCRPQAGLTYKLATSSWTSRRRTSHKQVDTPQSGLYYRGKRGHNFQGWKGEEEGLLKGLSVGGRVPVPRVTLRRRKE